MLICTLKFDKKKAVFWVIMAALVLIGIILLAGAAGGHRSEAKVRNDGTGLRTDKARATYLAECGWEVETPAMNEDSIVIPRVFSEVFENYNKLQKQQGFDLSDYCGMEVRQYTYRVLNSDIGDNVLAVLYICNGAVIGGDVHSTAMDGFICGLKK